MVSRDGAGARSADGGLVVNRRRTRGAAATWIAKRARRRWRIRSQRGRRATASGARSPLVTTCHQQRKSKYTYHCHATEFSVHPTSFFLVEPRADSISALLIGCGSVACLYDRIQSPHFSAAIVQTPVIIQIAHRCRARSGQRLCRLVGQIGGDPFQLRRLVAAEILTEPFHDR